MERHCLYLARGIISACAPYNPRPRLSLHRASREGLALHVRVMCRVMASTDPDRQGRPRVDPSNDFRRACAVDLSFHGFTG